MRKPSMIRSRAQKIFATLSAISIAPSAFAGSVNIQEFRPPAGMRYAYVENASSDCPAEAHGGVCPRWLGGANYDYLHDPLVELNEARDARRSVIVDKMHTLHLSGGYMPNRIYSLHLTAPLHIVNRVGSGSHFAMGDLRLFGKLNLFPGIIKGLLPFDLTIVPEMKIPSGRSDLFVSDGGEPVFGLLAVGERQFGNFHLALNWGYRLGTNARYRDIYYRQKMPVALAMSLDLHEHWSMNLEGQTQVVIPFNRYQNPSEIYLGGAYRNKGKFTAHLGGGIGSFNGVSSADWRVMAGVRIASDCFESTPLPSVPAKPDEAFAGKKDPRVVFSRDAIQVMQEVRFGHGNSKLTTESKELLNEVAEVIQAHQGEYKSVHVEGHTNKIGSNAINMRLSKSRAKSVREYLISRGVPKEQITSEGYGYHVPRETIPGYTEEQMLEANRRVEFKLK